MAAQALRQRLIVRILTLILEFDEPIDRRFSARANHREPRTRRREKVPLRVYPDRHGRESETRDQVLRDLERTVLIPKNDFGALFEVGLSAGKQWDCLTASIQ
jgi:hypothetical protein